jgi:hypothetical protein
MASFFLSAAQVDALIDLIEVGMEGAPEESAHGDDVLADVLAELHGIAEFNNGAEITILKDDGG